MIIEFNRARVAGYSLWLLLIVLAGPLVAQEQSIEADRPNNESTSGEVVAVADVVDDAAIRSRLKRIYEAASKAGWLTDADVVLESGIVTIVGQADTEEHRQWAANIAGRTEDVVAVINQLTVDQAVDFESTKNIITTSLDALWTDFLVRSPLILSALMFLVLTSFVVKAVGWSIRRVLSKRGMRTSLKDLIHQLTSIGIWVVGLMIAAVVAFPGMTPAKALTVLGLGSIAVGFAFKDIFENFFAGVLILWRYPFDPGDFITCGEVTGQVSKITIRNTLIRKLDGELSVVPNATLFKNNVDVLTSMPQRRVRIICGVAYGEDVDASRSVILKAVQSCDSVEGKRVVEVFAQEFASSSINFEVAWWTGSKPIDIRRSRDEVVRAIKRALDDAGIEIPFPYRTITFKKDDDLGIFNERSSADDSN